MPQYVRPSYVEPEVKTLTIVHDSPRDTTRGEFNPCSGPYIAEVEIGHKGGVGADYYSMAVATMDMLASTSGDEDFWWGRHLAVIDKVVPEASSRKFRMLLDRYCEQCAGDRKDVVEQLSKLGEWEFEDIDSGVPGRPRWHIRARLVDLWSPDIDLATFKQSEGEGFGIRVRARIGAEGGIEAGDDTEVFEFLLCTPSWLAKERDLSEFLLCSNMAFMNRLDLEVLRRNVQEVCTELKGYTAEEAIGKMSRYAQRLVD